MPEQYIPSSLAANLAIAELEALIRRVVREALVRLVQQQPRSIADNWSHECPDDPHSDAALFNDVLEQIEHEQATPAIRIAWEATKAELERDAVAGELPV